MLGMQVDAIQDLTYITSTEADILKYLRVHMILIFLLEIFLKVYTPPNQGMKSEIKTWTVGYKKAE